MSLFAWSTRDPLDPDFESAWLASLSRSSRAHFGLDPRYLQWESNHGRHSLAALVCGIGCRGGLVLRDVRGQLECGLPWRWSLFVEGAEAPAPSTPDARWLLRHAQSLAECRRLRCFVPGPPAGPDCYRAGRTLVRRIDATDDELMRSLHADKRRMVRRASAAGYRVVEADSLASMREFARVQRETERRRGAGLDRESAEPPAPGESWREWEHAWMWLLVAVRDGRVEAGSGFGRYPGASIDYRANASTERAKRDGANVLLAWEAMRRGRDQGYRWMNWCGLNTFKLQLGGDPIDVACQLSGGLAWGIPNLATLAYRRSRSAVSRWRHPEPEPAAAHA